MPRPRRSCHLRRRLRPNQQAESTAREETRSMPFSPLDPDLQMATWKQIFDTAQEISAQDRPRLMAIADWYMGVAQDQLREGWTREELAWGYGVSARQLRRWIKAFNEGGIPGLLQRRFGRGGRPRKIKAGAFAENFLAMAEESVPKRNGWVSGKALFNWCRTDAGLTVSYSTFLRCLGGHLRRLRKPIVIPSMDEYLAGAASGDWPAHLKEFGIRYRRAERRGQKKVRDWFSEGAV